MDREAEREAIPVRPSTIEMRHWTPRRDMYASGMSGASVLSS